jgi:hypothetical protein
MSRYPELIINSYVWKQFETAKPAIYSQYTGSPIIPVRDMSSEYPWGTKPYIIYDSFARPRSARKYFYPVKSAQLMYSIKGSISEIYEWRDFIINVLDREDDAAKDINEYAGENLNGVRSYFHCINAYQMNYIGNTTEQTGQRKQFSTNLIVKYDYHISDVYNA